MLLTYLITNANVDRVPIKLCSKCTMNGKLNHVFSDYD